MKFAIVALMFISASTTATAEPVKKDVVISVHDAFVPEHASPEAEVKIVLSGMFSNSCYAWNYAEVNSSGPDFTIRAHALLTRSVCLMVLVPFSKEVNLGRLAIGQHTIRFINGDETYFERTVDVQ